MDCPHDILIAPEWAHREAQGITAIEVRVACMNCGATAIVDLGDQKTFDWSPYGAPDT